MAAVAARSFWTNPDPDDPLSKALQPPIDETPEERTARIRELDEAARVSREIDDEIARDRRAYERRKKAIKILLLGACPPSSLSRRRRRRPRPGRVREEHDAQECVLLSSVPECCSRPADFQLAFSPQHFHKERAASRRTHRYQVSAAYTTSVRSTRIYLVHPIAESVP